MSQPDSVGRYKDAIRAYLNADLQVACFWKGRVALYALLESIGVEPGDEVIIPAFTCVVVPSAIIYRGAVPVYVDIDRATYNLDPEQVEARISKKTRAILAQNTFGLAPDFDTLRAMAAHYRLWLIEDCAHGLGGRYKGKLNGTQADAAFFSTQWNKPISTGLGGFAVTAHPEIVERLPGIEQRAAAPSRTERLKLGMLLAARDRLLAPRFYWLALEGYRWVSGRGLLPGSSQAGELSMPSMPPGYFKGMSPLQAKRGRRELCDVDRHVTRRRRIAAQYHEILGRLDVPPVHEPEYAHHAYLRYPLLVKNQAAFLAAARRRRIEVGDWLLSPIHPVRGNMDRWGYSCGTNPTAERISGQIVNLPTHRKIDRNAVDRVAQFLEAQADQLVRP